MASTRDDASTSYNQKLGRMGLGSGGRGDKIRTASMGENEGIGHVLAAEDGTQGTVPNGYADQYKNQSDDDRMLREKAAKPRLDRPGYKKGGRVKGKSHTTVNVIVAPQGPKMAPPPPMMPPPPGGAGLPPPPMPPGGPMGGLPGAGAMPRKSGGRVPHMDAGAGGGLGRLEKIKSYGKNAKAKATK